MIKNYNESIAINHTPNSPNIPDDPYRILIIGSSGSGKTNVLLNLIKYQRPDIDKIYLYVKDPFESKYQLLIIGRGKVEIKTLKNSKALLIIHKQLTMFMKIWQTIIQQRKGEC